MGRRYVRDNRGRFASTGATARGGRLRTEAGNKRATQKISVLSGDRMSSVPKGTVGKTRKQREITMIDRPLEKRSAYNAGRAQQQGLIAARKSAASRPAPGSFAATKIEQAKGRSAVLGQQKSALNKQLKQVNSQIKGAGTNSGGLRLQKLQVQDRLNQTRADLAKSKAASGNAAALKKQAKEQQQVANARLKVARLKRAQARFEATADTRNQPGSKMLRRPDAKTSRGNRRAEQARAIYMGASRQSISNFARGVARTPRARNNFMQPRPVRVAQAKQAGLPLVTVNPLRSR